MAYDYKELKAHGFMQQKQPGCFSMRLKSVGGKFTAAQLQTVQEVAEKFGEGYVHLTSRQGIEIPFIKEQDIEEVKKASQKGFGSGRPCHRLLRRTGAHDYRLSGQCRLPFWSYRYRKAGRGICGALCRQNAAA